MKVASIKYKLNEGSTNDYLTKISHAMPYSNIVLGPEYSLINLNEEFIKNYFSSLSKKYPSTLIVPGTFLKEYDENSVSMVAPIFYKGELVDYVFKKSDIGDSKIASKIKGKELHSAKMSELDKMFKVNGKNVRIYICADQGRYDLESPDLELVTSSDLANGFHSYPTRDLDKRDIIISDSQEGQTKGLRYNPQKENKLEELIQKDFQDFSLFKTV
ncbi:MAG: hypothetical protein PHH53_02950 [Candidatus Nanoarchaeia archaeon]|nr:hypothetical protein [Candidatus Nanoarchaeia archaeon]